MVAEIVLDRCTGCALSPPPPSPPEASTRRDPTGTSPLPLDGLPVDFIAQSISTVGANHYRTYHVVNHHDDGIGLDEYVDWIAEAGRPDRAHRRPRHLAPPLRIGASQPPRIAERTIVTVS